MTTLQEQIRRKAQQELQAHLKNPVPQETLISKLREESGTQASFHILTEYFLLEAFKQGQLPWSQGLLKYYFENPLKDFDDAINYDSEPKVKINQEVFATGDLHLHPGLLLCILDAMELKKSTNAYIRHLIRRDRGPKTVEHYAPEEPHFLETLFEELPEKRDGYLYEFNPEKYLAALTRHS